MSGAPDGKFCCRLNTPDPGPWTAGVDDSADAGMIEKMHRIRDGIASNTAAGPATSNLVALLRDAGGVDNRTLLGRDLQRCLLWMAADRLVLLSEGADPTPWRRRRDRLRCAWEVFRGRAVSIAVKGPEPRAQR